MVQRIMFSKACIVFTLISIAASSASTALRHQSLAIQEGESFLSERSADHDPGKNEKDDWEKHGEESWRNDFVPMDEHKQHVQKRKTHGHHLFALLLICLLVTFSVTFAMANSSNTTLANCAWGTADAVIVVVIAKSVFYIATHYFKKTEENYPAWHVTLHIMFASVFYCVALYGSYYLKDDPKNQQIFKAVIFWMVLLAKGGAIVSAQKKAGEDVYDVFLVTMISLGAMFLFMFVTHYLKPEANYYDDVEETLVGGAFAGAFVTVIGMLIGGNDHGSGGPWQDHEKTFWHMAVAILSCVAACTLTSKLIALQNAWKDTHYWGARFVGFFNSFIGILPYFTVSLGLGTAVCNRLGIGPDEMTAKLVRAMTGTVFGYVMIFTCALVPTLKKDISNPLPQLILGFGGYICGAGWGNLIIGSTENLVEGRGLEEHHRAHVKIAIIVVVYLLILLPMYVIYFKPAVIAKAAATAQAK